MIQVSMSSVNLNDAEAGFASTTGRGGKRRNDVLNTVDRQRLWHWVVIGKRQCARSHDINPAPITFGDGSVAFPWPEGASLATGMRQLHPSDAALLMNKADDSRQ